MAAITSLGTSPELLPLAPCPTKKGLSVACLQFLDYYTAIPANLNLEEMACQDSPLHHKHKI
jgi:hypothetical protein